MTSSGRPPGATWRTAPNSSPPSETKAWNPTLIFSCMTMACLFSLELWRTLLLEGCDAFFVIRSAAGRALSLSFALENREQAHRLFVDPTHQTLRLHERGSRALRYLRRDLFGFGDKCILRHGTIDESELRGVGTRQQPSGVNQLECAMRPEARGEKRMPARVQHCADSRERRSDLRVVGDVDDVASERESEANSEARAVNGRKS